MARVGVRTCDRCRRWDSVEQAVKRVTIVGPRKDLCASCRTSVLIEVGMSPTDAISYVLEQDGVPPGDNADQLTFEVVDGIPHVGEEAPDEPIPLVPVGD
jgi:hypothetical protein